VLGWGDLEADDFGFVVPAPNLEGGQVVWLARLKSGDFVGGERSTLEFQAALGGFREVGEVARLGGGQVALGVHVETYAVEHGLRKMAFEEA
jgi:hypothetical protein